MTKSLFAILLLFIPCFTSNAQEISPADECTPGTETYNKRFDKIIEMYSAMLDSQKSAEYRLLRKEFEEKSDYINAIGDEKPKNIDNWILDNISKTKFPDRATAEALKKRRDSTHTEVIVENAEMYKLLQEAVRLCGKDFLQAVYLELILKYRDDFHL